jgi:hypothetical protein
VRVPRSIHEGARNLARPVCEKDECWSRGADASKPKCFPPDPDNGRSPGPLGLDEAPTFSILIQENEDRQIIAWMGGPPKRR